MLKNLHIKGLACVFAFLLWVFVISLENTFAQLPHDFSVEVRNLASQLAVTSAPATVKLTVQSADRSLISVLSAADFYFFVDAGAIGEGKHRVAVQVASKNAGVRVVRVHPRDIELNLEPIRNKNFSLTLEVVATPAAGFSVGASSLSRTHVRARGAHSVLQKVKEANAQVRLAGVEKESFSTKNISLRFLDELGSELKDITTEDTSDIEVFVELKPSLTTGEP